MIKFIQILIIFFICQSAASQRSDHDTYNVINVVLAELSINEKDLLRINCKTVPFTRQKWFFTKDIFDSYAAGVVGIDDEKVQRLIELVDFKYLREEKSEVITLDTIKLKCKNFKLYDGNNINLLDGKKRYSFSEPVFSKDKKIAFIYIRKQCGHMDCSSDLVKVYKKRGNKWVFYTMFTI